VALLLVPVEIELQGRQALRGIQVLYGATFEIEGQAKPACVAEVIFRYYG
jgi:acyl dehydratase